MQFGIFNFAPKCFNRLSKILCVNIIEENKGNEMLNFCKPWKSNKQLFKTITEEI